MSMSVKNRVAIFESGKEDDEGASNRRSSTPNSFKRPTPAPSPPFGQSLLKPVTPKKTRSFNVKDLDSRNGRTSLSWPAEEAGIPAPDKKTYTKATENRRFSSSHLPPSPGPVIIPKSPMTKSSVVNTAFSSPQNAWKMPSPRDESTFKKSSWSPAPKPVLPSQPVVPSQLNSVSNVSSENKAPRGSEQATKNKALQLAKSRNSLTSYAKPNDVPKTDDDTRDDDVSSILDPELSSINRHMSTMDVRSQSPMPPVRGSVTLTTASLTQRLRSLTPEPVRSQSPMLAARGNVIVSSVNLAQSVRSPTPEPVLSSSPMQDVRANLTLSYANLVQQRAPTPDNLRTQSPLPAVRGNMTVSHVSHKEARKALLQAAQRKKDKADLVKEEEKKINAIKAEEEKKINAMKLAEKRAKAELARKVSEQQPVTEDLSKRSEGSAADRMANRAINVLKMKNSLLFGDIRTKESTDAAECHRDGEGSCNGSIASTSSRLKKHPAFAARSPSPRVSTQVARSVQLMASVAKKPLETKEEGPKGFSRELFSSIRHLPELRVEPKKSAPSPGKFRHFASTRAVHFLHSQWSRPCFSSFPPPSCLQWRQFLMTRTRLPYPWKRERICRGAHLNPAHCGVSHQGL